MADENSRPGSSDAPESERELRPRKAPAPKAKEVKKKVSHADYMRNWRKNRKLKHPELYRKEQDYNNVRVKIYKQNLTDEKKRAYQDKTNARVNKFRAKQPPSQQKPPPKTCAATKLQQKVWADYQASYRDRLNPQQKRRIKERRRQIYAEKYSKAARMKKQEEQRRKELQEEKKRKELGLEQTPTDGEPSTSKESLRKATNRARKSLPRSAKKYA